MRVLIATCAHAGADARIVHRQARILLEAGHQVTLISPAPTSGPHDPRGLERVEIVRAVGRRRLRSWREARRALRIGSRSADLVLLHDPELVPVALTARLRLPVVWDVHEDFVASVRDRTYIPKWARFSAIAAVKFVHRLARRRCHIIVAEAAYTAIVGDAPVVPNSTWVPAEPPARDPTATHRIVHVGRLSVGRGVHELLEVGRRTSHRAEMVLIGSVDAEVESDVRRAHERGWVHWMGPLTNPRALSEIDGALCGLSLLHEEPNYVHSLPTKLAEYMSRGVPVVTTPLPLAADLVRASGGGIVVPFGDVDCVVGAIDELSDPSVGGAACRSGYAYVSRHHNWAVDGAGFVEVLERWAQNPEVARKRREQDHHDQRFRDDPRAVTKGYYDVGQGKPEYRRAVISHVAPSTRVLEYGCGIGSLVVALGKQGGCVTGIDLSQVATSIADETARARFVGTSADRRPRFVQMDAERLAFADESFDLVCGSAILHHLDVDAALAEVARVLAPGGRAVFLEPLGHNPVINAYRRLTPSLRSEDEHPLRCCDLELARRYFASVSVEHHDLVALVGTPVRCSQTGQAVLRRLHRVDEMLFSKSALARRWSWTVLVTLSDPISR